MARVRINDPTLTRFRQALGRLYGNRLERVVPCSCAIWMTVGQSFGGSPI